MVDIVRPMLATQRKPARDGPTVADIATADYLDPSVGRPSGPPLRGGHCTRSTP